MFVVPTARFVSKGCSQWCHDEHDKKVQLRRYDVDDGGDDAHDGEYDDDEGDDGAYGCVNDVF